MKETKQIFRVIDFFISHLEASTTGFEVKMTWGQIFALLFSECH